jgi:hypothetical protein
VFAWFGGGFVTEDEAKGKKKQLEGSMKKAEGKAQEEYGKLKETLALPILRNQPERTRWLSKTGSR